MFNKIEISLWRAIFWPVANLTYWGLIFLSWWDTRVKVFFGVSILQKFLELRNTHSVTQILGDLEAQAYSAVAQSGKMSGDFIIIPLVMAIVLFTVPFIVRRDQGGPVNGFVILPAMTLLCYFFASFLNLILVGAMSTGIHYMLFKVPGPDICMFMVHPLYLIYPIFRNVPGFLSQCLYLLYTATVLCAESAIDFEDEEEREEFDDDEGPFEEEGGDDWDKSACLMEMDRFSRILNAKFDNPLFIERVREDIASYINMPGRIRDEINSGSSHYKIVLAESQNSLRSILARDPKTPQVLDVFAFIADEMARMEYITANDAMRMKTSVGIDPAVLKPAIRGETNLGERLGTYPAGPQETQENNKQSDGTQFREELLKTQSETMEESMERLGLFMARPPVAESVVSSEEPRGESKETQSESIRAEEKREIAKQMLLRGLNIGLISDITGLTEEEIRMGTDVDVI
ncbi:MAG: hypothetical protein FWE55_00120 [Synergistaceae bacterium]|nr:hypothetical protein [Synergistaceae bacterium]